MVFSVWYRLDSWYRSWFLLIFILRLISNICLKNSLKEMDKRSKIFLLVIINFFLDNLLVLLGENWYQWRIQGRGPECPPPRYSYSPPPLSESLDPPLDIGHFWDLKGQTRLFLPLTSPPAKAFLFIVGRRRVFLMLHRLVRIVNQAWSLSQVRRKERKKASPFTRGSSSFPREKCWPTKTHKNNACFTSYTNIFHQGQNSRGIYQNLLS